MIEPWQVWHIDLGSTDDQATGLAHMVVISSELHLRLQSGRGALVCPLMSRAINVRNHIPVTGPEDTPHYVMTEQIYYLNTSQFVGSSPLWTLQPEEIHQIQRVIPLMLDV